MSYASDKTAIKTYIVETPDHDDTFVVRAGSPTQASALALDIAGDAFDESDVLGWLDAGWPDESALTELDDAPTGYLIDG